ncbi:MAG TPA: FAD-dependent oxidoreductase [Burkholderiales bacterium]|nr:FAD-dependent oxidoreductase [Burkholderiales bacterium]
MGRHLSFWSVGGRVAPGSRLTGDLQVDVCVVGAGIAGLTTAYLLAKAGKMVAVLDDGPIGGGMTQMTSGHLTSMLDDRYFEVERLHGQQGARLAAESHSAAIDRIESIAREEKLDCDFARVDGYLFLAEGDTPDTLQKEIAAAHRAGLHDVVILERAPFASFDSGPCLRFPRQAQFHPLKYLAGLARAIAAHAGRVITGAHADWIEGGTPAVVRCGDQMVVSDAIVVATNVPVNDRVAIHTKQAPYMTYVIGARIPRGSVPAVLSWDTGDPYHYLRIAPHGDDDLLIVGGEDHKSGQADDTVERFERLEQWTRARFPMVRDVPFRWGGQIMETVDYLAFSGRNPGDHDNVFVHTGDSGMGLTHGTIGAMLICDLLLERDNRWARLYEPSRKTMRAARDYTAENLNVARQYADWLTAGEVDSAEDVPQGAGAIVRRGLRKIAVYRDESGALHEHSAVCPHLGCMVRWNRAERTWDCPCHGSRFDPLGKVINGPANRDLAPAERSDDQRAA